MQLLVQGGPGTIQFALDTARIGTPIVAVVNSGGAALALHQCLVLKDEEAAMVTFGLGGPQPKNPSLATKIRAQLHAIAACQEESGDTLLHFFIEPEVGEEGVLSSDGHSSDPLSSFLLKASA